MRYEIRVEGILDECWSGWFDGMQVTSHPDGVTSACRLSRSVALARERRLRSHWQQGRDGLREEPTPAHTFG
jgi:Tfp pilus assembly protein FimT